MAAADAHSGASGPSCPAQRNPGAHLDRDWPAYFDAVRGNPPRDTLLDALDRFDAEGSHPSPPRLAIDLGCGAGRDTFELLRRGWRVLAVDGERDGLDRLERDPSLSPDLRARLTTVHATFQTVDLPSLAPEGADLVNASFSLPFCPEPAFPRLWDGILAVLGRTAARGRPGRFCGQFFGDHDEWAGIPGRFHPDSDHVARLVEPFVCERHEEVEKDGKDAFGNPKHYHVHHVVARLRA